MVLNQFPPIATLPTTTFAEYFCEGWRSSYRAAPLKFLLQARKLGLIERSI